MCDVDVLPVHCMYSHCPTHAWKTRAEKYHPTKKSIFALAQGLGQGQTQGQAASQDAIEDESAGDSDDEDLSDIHARGAKTDKQKAVCQETCTPANNTQVAQQSHYEFGQDLTEDLDGLSVQDPRDVSEECSFMLECDVDGLPLPNSFPREQETTDDSDGGGDVTTMVPPEVTTVHDDPAPQITFIPAATDEDSTSPGIRFVRPRSPPELPQEKDDSDVEFPVSEDEQEEEEEEEEDDEVDDLDEPGNLNNNNNNNNNNNRSRNRSNSTTQHETEVPSGGNSGAD